MNTQDKEQQCREEFEAWTLDKFNVKLTYLDNEGYGAFQERWIGWQAAWKSKSESPPDKTIQEMLLHLRDGTAFPTDLRESIANVTVIKHLNGEYGLTYSGHLGGDEVIRCLRSHGYDKHVDPIEQLAHPTSNELIKEVARGICKLSWKYKGKDRDKYEDIADHYWTDHIDEAKAAIIIMATKGPIPEYFDWEALEHAIAHEYLSLPKGITWEEAAERLTNAVKIYIASTTKEEE